MIESLKGDDVVNKVGGRFHLTALVQHRVRELMDGARPLVERAGRNDIEVALDEVMQGKIAIAETQADEAEDFADHPAE